MRNQIENLLRSQRVQYFSAGPGETVFVDFRDLELYPHNFDANAFEFDVADKGLILKRVK